MSSNANSDEVYIRGESLSDLQQFCDILNETHLKVYGVNFSESKQKYRLYTNPFFEEDQARQYANEFLSVFEKVDIEITQDQSETYSVYIFPHYVSLREIERLKNSYGIKHQFTSLDYYDNRDLEICEMIKNKLHYTKYFMENVNWSETLDCYLLTSTVFQSKYSVKADELAGVFRNYFNDSIASVQQDSFGRKFVYINPAFITQNKLEAFIEQHQLLLFSKVPKHTLALEGYYQGTEEDVHKIISKLIHCSFSIDSYYYDDRSDMYYLMSSQIYEEAKANELADAYKKAFGHDVAIIHQGFAGRYFVYIDPREITPDSLNNFTKAHPARKTIDVSVYDEATHSASEIQHNKTQTAESIEATDEDVFYDPNNPSNIQELFDILRSSILPMCGINFNTETGKNEFYSNAFLMQDNADKFVQNYEDTFKSSYCYAKKDADGRIIVYLIPDIITHAEINLFKTQYIKSRSFKVEVDFFSNKSAEDCEFIVNSLSHTKCFIDSYYWDVAEQKYLLSTGVYSIHMEKEANIFCDAFKQYFGEDSSSVVQDAVGRYFIIVDPSRLPKNKFKQFVEENSLELFDKEPKRKDDSNDYFSSSFEDAQYLIAAFIKTTFPLDENYYDARSNMYYLTGNYFSKLEDASNFIQEYSKYFGEGAVKTTTSINGRTYVCLDPRAISKTQLAAFVNDHSDNHQEQKASSDTKSVQTTGAQQRSQVRYRGSRERDMRAMLEILQATHLIMDNIEYDSEKEIYILFSNSFTTTAEAELYVKSFEEIFADIDFYLNEDTQGRYFVHVIFNTVTAPEIKKLLSIHRQKPLFRSNSDSFNSKNKAEVEKLFNQLRQTNLFVDKIFWNRNDNCYYILSGVYQNHQKSELAVILKDFRNFFGYKAADVMTDAANRFFIHINPDQIQKEKLADYVSEYKLALFADKRSVASSKDPMKYFTNSLSDIKLIIERLRNTEYPLDSYYYDEGSDSYFIVSAAFVNNEQATKYAKIFIDTFSEDAVIIRQDQQQRCYIFINPKEIEIELFQDFVKKQLSNMSHRRPHLEHSSLKSKTGKWSSLRDKHSPPSII